MDALKTFSPLVGRILIALPLLDFGIYKLTNWEMMQGWLQYKGFPAAALFLGAAIAFELVGGALLIVGFQARWAALALALYLVPVTFVIHNFWVLEGAERQSGSESFGKGLMIIGGLLFVFVNGAGAFSVDNKLKR